MSSLLELLSATLEEDSTTDDEDGTSLDELSTDEEDSVTLEELFSEEDDPATTSEELLPAAPSLDDDFSPLPLLLDSTGFSELDDFSTGSVSLLLLDFADFSELEDVSLLTELDVPSALAELEGSVAELDKTSSTLDEDSSATCTGELSLASSPQAATKAMPQTASPATTKRLTTIQGCATNLINTSLRRKYILKKCRGGGDSLALLC